MSDTCGVDDARIILPDLIEQVRALSRPVVLTDEDQEPVAALVPAAWLDGLDGLSAAAAGGFQAPNAALPASF